MEWIKSSLSDMPDGKWLVLLEKPVLGIRIQPCSKRPNCTINGGVFGFDAPQVLAYQPLPNIPDEFVGEEV